MFPMSLKLRMRVWHEQRAQYRAPARTQSHRTQDLPSQFIPSGRACRQCTCSCPLTSPSSFVHCELVGPASLSTSSAMSHASAGSPRPVHGPVLHATTGTSGHCHAIDSPAATTRPGPPSRSLQSGSCEAYDHTHLPGYPEKPLTATLLRACAATSLPACITVTNCALIIISPHRPGE